MVVIAAVMSVKPPNDLATAKTSGSSSSVSVSDSGTEPKAP